MERKQRQLNAEREREGRESSEKLEKREQTTHRLIASSLTWVIERESEREMRHGLFRVAVRQTNTSSDRKATAIQQRVNNCCSSSYVTT